MAPIAVSSVEDKEGTRHAAAPHIKKETDKHMSTKGVEPTTGNSTKDSEIMNLKSIIAELRATLAKLGATIQDSRQPEESAGPLVQRKRRVVARRKEPASTPSHSGQCRARSAKFWMSANTRSLATFWW